LNLDIYPSSRHNQLNLRDYSQRIKESIFKELSVYITPEHLILLIALSLGLKQHLSLRRGGRIIIVYTILTSLITINCF